MLSDAPARYYARAQQSNVFQQRFTLVRLPSFAIIYRSKHQYSKIRQDILQVLDIARKILTRRCLQGVL